MSKVLNEFLSGINSDLDLHRIKNDMLRSAQNMRIANLDEKGMVAINIEGNEYSFQITQGHIPLGYCSYNGIAYIYSVHPTLGNGEIGTYPSPKLSCTGGFDEVYRPLRNFLGAVDPTTTTNPIRQDFTTRLFNFDCNHQVEVFARMDYDDSVNLYFCDQQKNPFRVINSGFNQDGVCNNRFYWNGSFPNGIEVSNESRYPISSIFLGTAENGGLKAGNYFVYVRYANDQFGATSFNCETGPFQISSDPESDGIRIDGQEAGYITNKSIKLRLRFFDPDYDYIEIAYIYYGGTQTENKLIDKKYSIRGLGTGGLALDVEITGFEPTVDIDDSDIFAEKPSDDIPETVTQFENRAWMGNIISRPVHHADLEEFAKNIDISADWSKTKKDIPWYHGNSAFPGAGFSHNIHDQHKSYRNTFDSVGYFRGETYAYTIRFVLTSGRVSLPYPMRGVDAWLSTATNQDGIFRFPSTNQAPLMSTNTNTGGNTNPAVWESDINIMGVRFTPTTPVTQWMIDNVVGFYYCRAERRPNLVYQGVMLPTWYNDSKPLRTSYHPGAVLASTNIDVPLWNTKYADRQHMWQDPSYAVSSDQMGSYGTVFDVQSDIFGSGTGATAPFIRHRGIYPGYILNKEISGSDVSVTRAMLTATNRGIDRMNGNQPDELRFGLYSFDHFFTGDFTNGNYHIYNAGKYIMRRRFCDPNASRTDSFMQIVVEQIGQEFTGAVRITHSAVGTNIFESTFSASNKHVSSYDEGAGFKVDGTPWTGPPGGPQPFASWLIENDPAMTSLYGPLYSTNMKFSVAGYIGLSQIGQSGSYGIDKFENTRPGESLYPAGGIQHFSLTNIYRNDPTSGAYDIRSLYNPASELYFAISEVLPFAELQTSIIRTHYKGDCFVQRTYQRQLSTYGYYGATLNVASKIEVAPLGSDPSAAQAVLPDSGVLHGFVTENSINSAMRYNRTTINEVYWPEDFTQQNNTYKFISYHSTRESRNINEGYSRTLGKKSAYGYDIYTPFNVTRYPTRIRYSEQHIPNSFFDFYKEWKPVSFKDFDFRMGPIKKIIDNGGRLWSIQESGISSHIVNERITMTPDGTTSGELLLGKGDVLSQKQDVVTDTTGSQHHWSVYKSENYLYGVDINKRLIWRIGRDGSFEPLSITKGVQNIVYDISEWYSDHSDIIHRLDDNPVCVGGVVTSYDRKYKELVFSFIANDPDMSEEGRRFRTIRFSELIDFFTGDYTNGTPMNILINEDYFGFHPEAFPSLGGAAPGSLSRVYLEGKKLDSVTTPGVPFDNYTTFFNRPVDDSKISFVVNDNSDIAKIFNAMELNSSDDVPIKIEYITSYQVGTQVPFLNPAEFYISPKYRENLWRFPVRRADAIVAPGVYGVGSPMRGKFMRVTITWNQAAQFYIKSAITDLDQSNS